MMSIDRSNEVVMMICIEYIFIITSNNMKTMMVQDMLNRINNLIRNVEGAKFNRAKITTGMSKINDK